MSGETNFSGVHKDSCAARGLGACALPCPGETISKSAQNSRAKRDPREPAREILARKNLKWMKLKLRGVPDRTNRVRLLLDRELAIARRACLCMV